MNRLIFFRALGIAFALLLFLLHAPSTQAQSNKLAIVIQTLTQNETIYIAPSAYLYSIYINGWVITNNPEPSLIKLKLELLRDGQVTASLSSRANSDSTFSFSVTANPDATDFPDPHSGCIECHFTSSIAFPPGRVLVRITASDPAGNQAIAERNVIIDRSGTAIIPIRVVDAEHPTQTLADVPVLGSARMYMWRGRTSSATTDANGQVRLAVEALSQSNTRYILDVPPIIVNGVLYAGAESKPIVLKPGQTESEPVSLLVRARRGQISGTLNGASDASLTVRAIDENTGATFITQARANAFAFSNLPVTSYRVVLDPNELASRSLQAGATQVDLTTAQLAQSAIALTTHSASSRVIRGTIRTASGEPVPFGWVEIEANLARTNPATGEFAVYDVPAHAQILHVMAPGFWSQSVAIQGNVPVSVTLAPRTESRSLAWGSGALMVPPETLTESANQHLILTHGWVWGKGTGAFALETAGATITLDNARVAIERQGERAWLYLVEGKANVAYDSSHQTTINAGQMLVLDSRLKNLSAVPFDSVVIRALMVATNPPSDFAIEPTFDAQVKGTLGQFGINVAQLVTFATYLIITLALVSTPFVMWLFWRRLKRQNHPTG